jgi:hypothetical protein
MLGIPTTMRITNRYEERFWLADLYDPCPLSTPQVGLFNQRYELRGRGRLWLKDLPADERKAFSELGHKRLREKGIDLQSLGGLTRHWHGKRDKRGRFVKGK